MNSTRKKIIPMCIFSFQLEGLNLMDLIKSKTGSITKKNILESGESNGHKSRIVPTSETVMIYGSVMKALKSRASAANQLYTLAVLIGKGKCGVSPPLQETKNVLLGNVIWNMPGNIK